MDSHGITLQLKSCSIYLFGTFLEPVRSAPDICNFDVLKGSKTWSCIDWLDNCTIERSSVGTFSVGRSLGRSRRGEGKNILDRFNVSELDDGDPVSVAVEILTSSRLHFAGQNSWPDSMALLSGS